MELRRLKLHHFRNYQELDISFNKKINIFIGNNAQGKTNLLESIYLLAISKSHKTYKDKELITFTEKYSRVGAELMKDDSVIKLEIIISPQGKKVFINDVEKRRISEYIGVFNVVMFAPEDLNIVKGDPSYRRKFLDVEIGQTSPIYIHEINQYNKILRERNEFLKLAQQTKKIDYHYLDVLTEQLAKLGASITERRTAFIDKLNIFAKKLHNYISNFTEDLEIKYQSNYQLQNMTYESILKLYKEYYQTDLQKATTQLGIQRDDIRFYINNIDASLYGSQGQQRTVALAVKLSLIDFIKEETNHYPIVLLDDVLSELDDQRQTQLLDCIKDKVQTFVTTTNITGIKKDLLKKAEIFYIKDAKVYEREGDHDGDN